MFQTQTTVKNHGLTITDVPFPEGEAVLIMVEPLSKNKQNGEAKLSHDEYVRFAQSLRGSAPGLDTSVEREADRI